MIGGSHILQKTPKSIFEAAYLEMCTVKLCYLQDINIYLK